MLRDELFFEVKGITKWIYDNPNRIPTMETTQKLSEQIVSFGVRSIPNHRTCPLSFPILASYTKQLNKKLLLLEDVL